MEKKIKKICWVNLKSHIPIDVTGGKQAKESKVIFLFKLQTFHAGCDREAGWSKHLSYSLPAFVFTYLILLSCSAALSSWEKRLQAFTANLKHRLKSWTCLTDWLSSLLHLLSSPVSSLFTPACPLTHKVADFLLLLVRSTEPSGSCSSFILCLELCVLFIKQKHQPGSVTHWIS